MNLKISGDKELWLYRQDEQCFPLYVTPCASMDERYYCLIRPALSPVFKQYEALSRHFAVHSIGLEKDHWVIEAAMVSKLLERAPGVTPEYYYLWDGLNKPLDYEEDTFEVDIKLVKSHSKDAEAFLQFLHDETGIATMDDLRALWHVLQRWGQEWLYRKQKTLDLGFVRLDALPYRQNWKQIFLARLPGVARWFRKPPKERRALMEINPETANCIRGSWMIEIDSSEWFVYWTIEARQTSLWREYVAKNERKRYRNFSRFAYASWWRSQVNRMEHRIYDILSDFVLATARPCAGLPPCDVHGRTHLVPKIPEGRVLPQGEDYLETFVVSPDPTQDVDGRGELGEVRFPPEPLPPVPDVQPAAEDMRNSGRVHTGDG